MGVLAVAATTIIITWGGGGGIRSSGIGGKSYTVCVAAPCWRETEVVFVSAFIK